MLEQRIGLEGEALEGGELIRYRWQRDGATMVVDLYDPTKTYWLEDRYKQALGSYHLVHFAGHSEYGTRHLLSDHDRFAPHYQILMMWSCHSYAYYARQFFRAKAQIARALGLGASDPDGFGLGDFVGTAPTPFFGDEDDGIEQLLRGLMDGIAAVARGEPEQAPDWLTILERMNLTSWDRPYGAAGARENSWRP